jgi:DNA polymerase IV
MDLAQEVRWMFVDFNAYFASVEQQEEPAIRGKPVVVVPVMVDSTCCIAASYEAKAFGIKTGTSVAEAKLLCPKLIIREARHQVYVRYHHALVEAVDTCVPVDTVLSIDEMRCRLIGRQRDVNEAVALAQQIKTTIRQRVGAFVRCSIGVAPNRYLAKVAGDMQKPDGLTVIRPMDLPQILFRLSLRDLPGIASRMEARLNAHGIHTMEQLLSMGSAHIHETWGSILGDRLWTWLHGEETEEPPTQRRTVGHSHILEPDMRSIAGAYRVAKQLTSKAAVRLRRMGYRATGMSVAVQFMRQNTWVAKGRLDEMQDTPAFLKKLDSFWEGVPPGVPMWVGITFCPVIPNDLHTPSFFDNPRQEQLSLVMDQINERFGRDTTYFAPLADSIDKAPTRISFTQIPDLHDVSGFSE